MDSQNQSPLLLGDVTGIVIGGFYDVYNELSGFPEYVLRRGMVVVLEEKGLTVHEEVQLPVFFRGRQLSSFRADLLVHPNLLVEIKAAPTIQKFHKAQLLHYLKAANLEVGLLLNFGEQPSFQRVIYQSARDRPRVKRPIPGSEVDSEGSGV